MKRPACCEESGFDCQQGDFCPERKEVSDEALARFMGRLFVGLLIVALLLSTMGEIF